MKIPRATSTLSRDIASIRQLAAAWRSGWHEGDAKALISLYDKGAVLMPQGQPAIFGKVAIYKLYRSALREVRIKSTSALREVEVAGNWGYFWSTYSLRVIPKGGGKATISRGKSMFIVRRQKDSTWKIARLIDNSDQ